MVLPDGHNTICGFPLLNKRPTTKQTTTQTITTISNNDCAMQTATPTTATQRKTAQLTGPDPTTRSASINDTTNNMARRRRPSRHQTHQRTSKRQRREAVRLCLLIQHTISPNLTAIDVEEEPDVYTPCQGQDDRGWSKERVTAFLSANGHDSTRKFRGGCANFPPARIHVPANPSFQRQRRLRQEERRAAQDNMSKYLEAGVFRKLDRRPRFCSPMHVIKKDNQFNF